MTPATYNMPAHRRGDTTDAIPFTIERGDPLAAVNLTGAAINIKFRDSKTQKVAMSLSVGSGITVTSAAAGQFRINKGALTPLDCGVYYYDIELIESGGDKKTYVKGSKTVELDTTF